MPIELVREIAGDGEFFETLPDAFPLPDLSYLNGISFRLLGSRDTGFQQAVFLRTSGSVVEVVNVLSDAYLGNGWTDVSTTWGSGPPVNTPSLGIRGVSPVQFNRPLPIFRSSPFDITDSSPFIVDDIFPLAISLCHDQFGTLNFQTTHNTTEESSIRVTYIPSNINAGFIDSNSCQEKQAYIDAGLPDGRSSYFQNQIPVLAHPNGTQGNSSSFGGIEILPIARFIFTNELSGIQMKTGLERQFTLPDTDLVFLYAHYSIQLEEQGWILDSNSMGTLSSSSVWTKTAEGIDIAGVDQISIQELNLQGVLNLLDSGNNAYHIWLRMISR